jgi:hypothetical protein
VPGAPRTPDLAVAPLLEVRNDHWLSVRIFASRDGRRHYLGEVPPATTAYFKVSRTFFSPEGTLRLLADPRGAAMEFETQPFAMGHGRRIEWRLKKNLYGSRPRVM